MTQYDVYLAQISPERVRAHVLALPGCFAQGATVDEALTAVKTAIQTRENSDEPPALHIAEQVEGPQYIFTPEQAPISREAVQQYLRLAAGNRQSLLNLVQPLVFAMCNWKPYADRLNINQVLLHIGHSECWFVSRLLGEFVEPRETTVMRFLKESRAAVTARLSKMPAAALTAVVSQPLRTRFPDEVWSARKVLRRLLEHELEHIAHIEEILAEWRHHYDARLTAERANLLATFQGLSAATLTQATIRPGWTAKDLLAHIAFYDAFHSHRLQMVLDGRLAEIEEIGDDEALAEYNAGLLAQFKTIPLEQAVAMLLKERSGYQAVMKRIPDRDLHQRLTMPWGWQTSMRVWANWRYRHDREHGREIARWRQICPPEKLREATPKFIMTAFLKATRKAFLALLPLLPEPEWSSRPVCGVWTLKDLLGHLTDWEVVAVDGLRQLTAGQTPEFDYTIADFDSFNNPNAAARKEQSWQDVWSDFEQTRADLLATLEQVSEKNLRRRFKAPWGSTLPGYYWPLIWAGHEMEHAVDVRHALGLYNWPNYLVKHR